MIRIASIAFILSLLLAATACRKEPASAKHTLPEGLNLLIITIDTLRADHVGAYGHAEARTPVIDGLARDGVMFNNCYSSAPLTLPSHCSLFTGRYPFAHRVRDNGLFFLSEEEETLAEKLKSKGYHTSAFISSFVVHSMFGLSQGFDVYDDSLNEKEIVRALNSEITADSVYAKFKRWFDENSDKKFFSWVHFFDPHLPYTPPDEFRKQFKPDEKGRYDAEIAYTDSYVGKIINDLKNANMLDKTLIIITGDHGEAFGEHVEYGHSIFCYEEAIRVPLILYRPGSLPQNMVVDSRVSLIDVMPTVCDLFSLDISEPVQGVSLTCCFGGERITADRTFYFESMHGREEMGWAPLTGIIDGDYKYIQLPEPELYDLDKNKNETDNLFLKNRKKSMELQAKLARMIENSEKRDGESRRELTESDRKHLESLGYVSSTSRKTKQGADPKRVIAQTMRYEKVNKAIVDGNLANAEKELKAIVEEYPGIQRPALYYHLMKKIYLGQKRIDDAVALVKEAMAVYPDNHYVNIEHAAFLLDYNRLDEAESVALAVLAKDTKMTKGYLILGDIAERKNLIDTALKHFGKAVNTDPKNLLIRMRYLKTLVKANKKAEAVSECAHILKNPMLVLTGEEKKRIGIILTDFHQDQMAHDVLEQILTEAEGDAEIWNCMGAIHFRNKRDEQAMAAFKKAIDFDPRMALAHNNMGGLYLRIAQQKKDGTALSLAVQHLTEAIRNDVSLASAYVGRGTAFKFAGKAPEALADWKKALDIKPDIPQVYLEIGNICLKTQNKEDALKYLTLCKERYFDKMAPQDQNRLNLMLREAGGM